VHLILYFNELLGFRISIKKRRKNPFLLELELMKGLKFYIYIPML
jgi:hypothetical protein